MKLNIEHKLETTVQTLRQWEVVKYIFPLEVYFAKVDKPSSEIPNNLSWEKFNEPYLIFKTDTHYWFKCAFDIDEINDHQKAFLCIESFIQGVASTIRPQGLVYLNDELIQGVDINHTDVLIKKPGHYEMNMLFYTHTFSFSFPLYFSLKIKDTRIMDSRFDFEVPLEWLKTLKQDDERYLNALPILDKAMNFIDFRHKHNDEFYHSLELSKKYLYDEFYNKYCGHEEFTINCVPHSHIDVAWLWELEQTRQKVQRTFSTALYLMDEYDEYRYMHTTPQVFEFIKNDNPLLFNKIKEKVKEGKFELDGSMWVEADNNLTSGESLVRQIYYGRDFFKKEFNVDCSSVFEPDVFGYSAQLPQIISKFGLTRFVTAKIGWNDTNRFPYDTFNWIALDGSSVLTYLISTCDANPRAGIPDTTYTNYVGEMKANQLVGTINRYQNKDINKVLLSTIGFGDGGGGPTREMIEKNKRFAYGLPGLGKTRIAGFKETVDEIESNVKNSDKLNSWKGELYLEFHRGTYTSVPRIKMNNRKAEFSLMNLEFISSFAHIYLNKPYQNIDEYWKLLLLNQFHDIVPGSSIEKVYLDSDEQFKKLFSYTDSSINNMTEMISNNIPSDNYIVFNFNGFKANAPIEINNKIYIAKDVPSYGYKELELTTLNTVKVSSRCLENEYLKVTFNDNGAIISLFDKINDKELVKENAEFNKFVVYEDMPYEYDNWEMTPYHFEKAYEISNKAQFEIIDDGDRKGLLIKIPYYNSEIIQKVYMYSGINKIDFVTDINWKEERQLLKVLFPLNFEVTNAQYDVQFGNLSRNAVPQNSFDEAKFEVPAHKWVDANNGEIGVGLMNNGKYGHHISKDLISLTLLKSGSFPYYGASDVVPTFTYSIYPHKGTFNESNIIEESYLLNRPLLCKKANNNGDLPVYLEMFSISEKGIYLETIKEAFDSEGMIVRLIEEHNKKHNFRLKCGFHVEKAYICDLKEDALKEVDVKDDVINLDINPYEILTLRIK